LIDSNLKGPNAMQHYNFPFDVPFKLAEASSAELRATLRSTVDFAAQFSSLGADEHTAESVEALEASAELATRINDMLKSRKANVQKATTAAASLATFSAVADEDDEDEDGEEGTAAEGDEGNEGNEGDTAPEGGESVTASSAPAVTASSAPPVRRLGRRQAAADAIPQQPNAASRLAVMRIASEAPGFHAGQELSSFNDAARALSGLMGRYPTMNAGRAQFSKGKRPVTVYDPSGRKLTMKNFVRNNGIEFARNFPEQLRVLEGQDGYAIAEFAANERRLEGGSLINSMKLRVKSGRSITAAAAWCAVSEVIYQLCELESLDGMISVPELQTSRGGWQLPVDGGPDFRSIWNGIGNAGDTHLTETDVEKVCTEIPCPDFEDVRLGVDYVCLTGGLLQRRGYPEIVARFSRGAMIALQHKINMGVIADMASQSGPAIPIPMLATGDDAAAAVLSAVELAITDIKYANRILFGATLEVVMPMWFLPQIRAGLARRRGVLAVAVSDAEIIDWFQMRRAAPQFVYDWQDAYTGLADGPGGVDPLTALPTTGQFLVYPSGTWVKAVQDVVSLDTIYDSTNLQTNQYTAIFAEDGWAMLQMCPDSRLYEVALDPSGVVGCCPPELISV
jgi:hypothetical protein